MREVLDNFAAAVTGSLAYACFWKERTERPVIGSFPIHLRRSWHMTPARFR